MLFPVAITGGHRYLQTGIGRRHASSAACSARSRPRRAGQAATTDVISHGVEAKGLVAPVV